MRHNGSGLLSNAFGRLQITPTLAKSAQRSSKRPSNYPGSSHGRLLSTTPTRMGSWLEPSIDRTKKMMKGRPRVPTGGSSKGTTVMWGDYGLRMDDFQRRISAKHLKVAEDTIKTRLRGEKYRLYKRVACNVGVYTSGNETRMGKGKGSFDYWACRVAVNQIVFEIRGLVHERIIRDALRLAGNKLPGHYEIVKKGDAACVGITKLNGVTLEELKRPRRQDIPEALLAAHAKATAPRSSVIGTPATETPAVTSPPA